MFVLFVVFSRFPFLYMMPAAGTNAGFTCEYTVQIVASIRKEREQCCIVLLNKQLRNLHLELISYISGEIMFHSIFFIDPISRSDAKACIEMLHADSLSIVLINYEWNSTLFKKTSKKEDLQVLRENIFSLYRNCMQSNICNRNIRWEYNVRKTCAHTILFNWIHCPLKTPSNYWFTHCI